MEDTWAWRDLPVLDAVVSQLDEVNETGGWPDLPDIAEATGLGDLEVAAALDGEYLDLQRTVTRVTRRKANRRHMTGDRDGQAAG
jgi:hypothetical protein